LLTHDLLPHQKRDKRYLVQNNSKGDTSITSFQRSWFDNMLRKFLGDKKVALLIWQHGIPSIADPPLRYRGRVDSKVLDMGMLQSGLEECLQWYICLANHIVVHQNQEGFDAQLSNSSLDEQDRQRQQTRRQALQKARDALQLGATLAEQRDSRKRSYDDMDDAEQKMLEDYDTGRAKKAKQSFTIPRMKPFRCELHPLLQSAGHQATFQPADTELAARQHKQQTADAQVQTQRDEVNAGSSRVPAVTVVAPGRAKSSPRLQELRSRLHDKLSQRQQQQQQQQQERF